MEVDAAGESTELRGSRPLPASPSEAGKNEPPAPKEPPSPAPSAVARSYYWWDILNLVPEAKATPLRATEPRGRKLKEKKLFFGGKSLIPADYVPPKKQHQVVFDGKTKGRQVSPPRWNPHPTSSCPALSHLLAGCLVAARMVRLFNFQFFPLRPDPACCIV